MSDPHLTQARLQSLGIQTHLPRKQTAHHRPGRNLDCTNRRSDLEPSPLPSKRQKTSTRVPKLTNNASHPTRCCRHKQTQELHTRTSRSRRHRSIGDATRRIVTDASESCCHNTNPVCLHGDAAWARAIGAGRPHRLPHRAAHIHPAARMRGWLSLPRATLPDDDHPAPCLPPLAQVPGPCAGSGGMEPTVV